MLLKRECIDLSEGWRYVPEKVRRWEACAGGEEVALPHCWNRQDAFQAEVPYRRGWGSYAISFRAPVNPMASPGQWWLVSDGFYGWGRVRLNGRSLGPIDGEYLGMELALPELALERNELLITLSNTYRRDVLPGQKMPDFQLYVDLQMQRRQRWHPLLFRK